MADQKTQQDKEEEQRRKEMEERTRQQKEGLKPGERAGTLAGEPSQR